MMKDPTQTKSFGRQSYGTLYRAKCRSKNILSTFDIPDFLLGFKTQLVPYPKFKLSYFV